jgi:hypothetical protein
MGKVLIGTQGTPQQERSRRSIAQQKLKIGDWAVHHLFLFKYLINLLLVLGDVKRQFYID